MKEQDIGAADWEALAVASGAVDDSGLAGITVRHVQGREDDVVLCDARDVDERIRTIARSTSRTRQPERVFMARAMRAEASTAAALLIRAIIGRWVFQRGDDDVRNAHERRALAVIENHLVRKGHPTDGDVKAGRMQIAASCIKTPTSHEGVIDVVRKAAEQLRRQIDGRVAIVAGVAMG